MKILQPPLPLIDNTTKYGDHIHWGELAGSSQAMAIANAVKSEHKQFVVLTENSQLALQLEQEIRFFLGHAPDINIRLMPDWETLPYDPFSPHQDIVSQRLETLWELQQGLVNIVIAPITTALQRLSPPHYLQQQMLHFKTGDVIDRDEFRRNLERAGYLHVSQVREHSEFSVRGSIIDLYPMGADEPIRIDLFDDEIESLHYFDVSSQRSKQRAGEIKLLPAREFPSHAEAISQFREAFLATFGENNSKESIFYQVSQGTLPGGVEYYLPLFFDTTVSLFDYCHQQTIFCLVGDIQAGCQRFWLDLQHRYEQYRYNPHRPLLTPDTLYLNKNQFFRELKHLPRISIHKDKLTSAKGKTNFACQPLPEITLDHQKTPRYQALDAFLKGHKENRRTVFVSESAGRQEKLIELLQGASFKPKTIGHFAQFQHAETANSIVQGRVESGFIVFGKEPLIVITETNLLGQVYQVKRRTQQRKATDEGAIIRNLAELTEGQPVVHLEHGIGRYVGLQTLDAGGVTTEYLTIEYKKGSKLYVPVANLHLIARYSGGDPERAPLHLLGTDTWSKAKQKAAEKVRDVAAELLNIYAQRAAKPGFSVKVNSDEYSKFSQSFPYETTPDQQQAIDAVMADMRSEQCMDRLVCGDVGFGKTEVAMRAAFLAANDGKQVAILVPTTLLAMQHFENFRDRFNDFPIRIEVISRFIPAKQQKLILADLAAGKVDIIVGTHKLIQKDVQYDNLGLVIIDEEHRFGVRQKDQFKALRADVDMLTLTATPIPRTLNMAMSGMRDLSIIATPPAKRLPIKTFVMQRQDEVIREAVMREILRGGQVYFLHNEVDSIARTARELALIVPEARIAIAHGQMKENELEHVMDDFYHQRYNLLLCTTIIETGIDIPSANTIIMDRADHLGLAQLHQLRGRVGRSHHQAYAYLLTPHERQMTKDAKKRLDAISSLEDLGAGFALATHDLEIRGAGELLGDDQSGQIASVGFTLYMEMLDKAVQAIKDGKEIDFSSELADDIDIELRVPALLPDDYIGDVNQRLSFYKRLANCQHADDIDDIQVELIDRFGLLPPPAKALIEVQLLKLQAKALGIKRLDASHQGGVLEFSQHAEIDPGLLIRLIQQQPSIFKFDGPTKLRITKTSNTAAERLIWVAELLTVLAEKRIAA